MRIIVGVLQKYVNIAAGWRPRLFVLQQGVLRYYHLHGAEAVDVVDLLDTLREQGDVVSVGVEIGVLERRELKHRNLLGGSGKKAGMTGHGARKARVDIHVCTCRVRESNADSSKFYVEYGVDLKEKLELRSECQDDRWVWIRALQDVMEKRGGLAYADDHAIPNAKIHFADKLEMIQAHLDTMGAGREVKAYVIELVSKMHMKYHDLADSEHKKRKTLLDIVYRLENEKRELETSAAVEAGLLEEDIAGEESEDESSTQQYDSVLRHSICRDVSSDEEHEEEEDDDDEFYECETYHHMDGVGHSRHSSLGELAVFSDLCSLDMEHMDDAAASRQSSPLKDTGIKDLKLCHPIEPSWLVQEGPAPARRSSLPAPQQPEKGISLWSLIKEMVGKDLTRVCLPVYFNEPLSALELTAEDLEYSELLDEAYGYPAGSLERMVRVAAFAISPYSSTEGRTSKPFNPLLGETYELVHVEKGFRYISEKVSHHPTIIAAHAEGRGWTYQGDAEIKSKFWGRSIELRPEGVLKLDFEDGDSYTWNKVTTSINNLILGKIYVDHGGVMKIRNPGNNMVAKIRFKETSMLFDKNPRYVEGFIEVDRKKQEFPLITGHWNNAINVLWGPNKKQLLWQKNPPPENPTRYNLTKYAIQLNEITEGLKGRLAPTDSRLRPDQSFTEKGMWEEANAEKQRLEHKQRAARKAAEQGVPLKPRWFKINYEEVNLARLSSSKRHISGKELSFEFNGEYWLEREQGYFSNCRDIFGASMGGPDEVSDAKK